MLHIYIYIYVCVCVCVCVCGYVHKQGLALNNLQMLICHKTQPTKKIMMHDVYLLLFAEIELKNLDISEKRIYE